MQAVLLMWRTMPDGQTRDTVKFWSVREQEMDASDDRYRPGRGTNLSLTAPCLYPGCGNTVELRLRGGLPTQFCSADCRSNYRNISRQLQRTEAALVKSEGDDRKRWPDGERDDALRIVRWHLARFGSVH